MSWWAQLSANIKPQLIIGEIRLNYYGLIIGVGILSALWLAGKRAKKYNLQRDDVESLVWWGIIPGFIGARLYHVLDNWNYYLVRPFDMVAVWNGGLAIYGGLLGGFLGLLYGTRLKKVQLFPLLDLFAPSIVLSQSIGRWGNFFNMEGFGPPTELPWKIFISPSRRVAPYFEQNYFHPLFLYESIWNLIIVFILLVYAQTKPKNGSIIGLYLVLYGLGRFLIESGRLDTAIIAGFKLAQIFSLFSIFIGIAIIYRKQQTSF